MRAIDGLRRRWIANLAIALVGTAVATILLASTGLRWQQSWPADPVGVIVVGTFLTFIYQVAAPAISTLAVIEVFDRWRGPPGRLAALVVAAVATALYLVVVIVLMGADSITTEGYPVFAIYVAFGAAFGAVLRLPTATTAG